MILVALDTATPSTVAGVLLADGTVVEARDDPPAGARGDHAARLLVLAEQALAEGGVTWRDVERIVVGVGPGGFTGLRIGVATARALAQGHGLPLVPVSSLRALAAGVPEPGAVAAVLDARRGEAFAGAWDGAQLLIEPAALAPDGARGAAARAGRARAGRGGRGGTLQAGARRSRGRRPGRRISGPPDRRGAALPARRGGRAGRP